MRGQMQHHHRPAALVRTNPAAIEPKEWAGVAAVGLVGSYFTGKILSPLLVGTGMYLLGYYIRGRRPEDGWTSGY